MVSVEESVIARLTRDNQHFEILVDPDRALELKRGRPVSIEKVLVIREVFRDSKKGERVSDEDLQKTFGTRDILKIAEAILKHGEIQIKTEQKRALTEEKKKEIANIICRRGVDPKTKLPHPVTRILNAMEQAHVNIDPFKPAREQVQTVISKIIEIIPMSMEKISVAIRIPMQYAGKVSSSIRSMAEIKKEEWRSDCWLAVIEIPAGMQSDVYDKLNSMTAGKAEVKVLKDSLSI